MEEKKKKKKNIHAQALSKLGAKKGGAKRWANMTVKERSDYARWMVGFRWLKDVKKK
jgi:hypothetical protein